MGVFRAEKSAILVMNGWRRVFIDRRLTYLGFILGKHEKYLMTKDERGQKIEKLIAS